MTDQLRRRTLARAARMGGIAAIGTIYLALIGIIERFQPRNVITDLVTLGLLAPAIIVFVMAYRAAAPPRSWGPVAPSARLAAAASIVAGGVAGTGIALFLLLNQAFDLRGVLVSATPRMQEILSLGLDFPLGAIMLIGAGLGLGAAAALLRVVPPAIRGPLIVAMVSVLAMSLMEPFMRVVLLQLDLNAIAGTVYRAGGLTALGGVITFVVVLGIGLFRSYRGAAVRDRVERLPADRQRGIQIAAFVALGLVLLLLPQLIGSFLSEVVGTVGLYILMALGLNIVVGYAGLLDLGYVAFFAIGAYASAILTSPVSALGWELNFFVALPIVVVVAAIAGLLIGAPVLRLRGDYLAIVTLGIGEIVRILLLSDALRPWTGGAQGILQVPGPELLGLTRQPQSLYYPILFFVVLGAVVAMSLANSRIGRAWNAMREDEDVASATGINVTNYKLLAFSIGAVFGCLAGAFLAIKLGSVFPHGLDILVSITVLSVIILGGMGSIPGVMVGAFVLVGLPELLREFGEYRLLIYGAVLIGMMLWRPEGLIPSAQRRLELHDADDADEQWERTAGAGTPPPVVSSTT